MNKVLRMSLLALATVALMGSCKKKEPNNGGNNNGGTNINTNGGGGTNNGGNNGGGTQTPTAPASTITLTLPAGQKFALKGIEGDNITIGGVAVANFPYKSSNEPKEFTSQNGSIEIKGNVKSLTLSSGALAKLEVPNGLETLRMTTGATTQELVLTNATSLKMLSLSEAGVANSQDLSGLTNLQTVYLHKAGSATFTLPKSVKTLTLSENPGVTNAFDLVNFPDLVSAYFIGTGIGRPVDFSGSTKLKTFGNSRSALTTINLKNCSALANVLLRDMNGTTSVDLSGCPLLKEGAITNLTTFTGFTTNENSLRLVTLNLAGASLEKFDNEVCTAVNLTSLDLSGNKLAAAKFDKFTALKTLNLLNNPTLKGTSLTEALKTLPATNGTIKIAGLSASDAAIVAQRGWTVAQ